MQCFSLPSKVFGASGHVAWDGCTFASSKIVNEMRCASYLVEIRSSSSLAALLCFIPFRTWNGKRVRYAYPISVPTHSIFIRPVYVCGRQC